MKKLYKLTTLLFVVHLFFTVTTSEASAAEDMDVWWPTNGAKVKDVQPFKTLLQGKAVHEYHMFWQVDNGGWVWMDNNYEGYPHKEAQVDLSGWSWRGNGPYTINFIATTTQGVKLTEKSVQVYIDSQTLMATPSPSPTPIKTPTPIATPVATPSATPAPCSTPTPTPAPALVCSLPTPTPTPTPELRITEGNPLSGLKMYIDHGSQARKWVDANKQSRPYEASLVEKIASQPQAEWLGGWSGDIYSAVKKNIESAEIQGAMPTLIAYNIPQRDCGSYSAGGLGSPDAYRSWIRSMADAIGGKKAVVVLEPDALPGMDCLSWNDRETRISLLREAIETLSNKGAYVYVDAGNVSWHSAEEMASRLKRVGLDNMNGFSLNVSGFVSTNDSVNYGKKISDLIGRKHFVIDTSRNGLGSNGEWCNPQGRALGSPATTNTGHSVVDAFLWLKKPGESDGWCNGGPSAGTFWPEYAIGLSQRANW